MFTRTGGISLVRCRISFLDALADRILIADGAMGTMLQAADLSLDDFEGYEGCNEVLNVTRPDVVRAVHDAYFAAGADCVETNTFGANLANLGEYGIEPRIRRAVGGRRPDRPARRPTRYATPERPRFVLGSIGPGTKLPTLGHVAVSRRCATRTRRTPRGCSPAARRADRRDLPGPAPGQGGGHRRPAGDGRRGARGADDLPRDGRDHRHDAARQRDRRRADRARAARRRPDRAQLRDRSGRDERAPALPVAARPRAAVGDAERRAAAADLRRRALPADARRSWPTALDRFVNEYGVALVGGCCGTTPGAHPAVVAERLRGATPGRADAAAGGGRRPRSTTTCRSRRTPAC